VGERFAEFGVSPVSVPTIMLIGDSLTAPYVPTFAKLLTDAKVPFRLIGTQGKPPLSHEGHGGYRVQMIADALPGYLAKAGTPQYAAVCLGTNDLATMPFPDVAKILAQWQNLIASLTSRGVRVLVCTTPQTTLPNSPGFPAFNRGVRAYATNRARVTLADLERGLSTADLSADQVHLSAAGAARMGTIIARAFSAKVGKKSIGGAVDELKRRRIGGVVAVVAVGAALYFWH
jgi:lysophospholipase L1-like esterase